jgi:flavin-dependent dehydrogenase
MLFAFAPDSQARLAELVGGSSLVRRSIAGRAATSTSFGAAPAFSPDLAAGRQFAIGSAAMTFDPLSGDGVAASIRSAHLAAALADAVHRGTDLDEAHRAYAARLARAMDVHLKGLLNLYSEAPFAGAWAAEIAATERMLDAVAPLAGGSEAPAFAISDAGVLAATAP